MVLAAGGRVSARETIEETVASDDTIFGDMAARDRTTILVVDDERDVVGFVRDALEDEGYEVLIASDGEEALDVARAGQPDLVVLDVMMPKLDGYGVCRVLREEMDVPILLLTARQGEADKVVGFGMGADDYVVKPFGVGELLARIEAHLRRERRSRDRSGERAVLSFGGLTVDLKGREVRVLGETVPLTRKEYEILELLALHAGRVFSREQIYEKVWQLDALGSPETVTEHVKRVRKKLETADPRSAGRIATVWGVGYKWEPKAP